MRKEIWNTSARFDSLKAERLCMQTQVGRKAYDGEDINGNNQLDAGEDLMAILLDHVLHHKPKIYSELTTKYNIIR